MARHTISLSFELRGEGSEADTRREIAQHLRQAIRDDFGREAWGGYDGPKVLRLRVSHSKEPSN